MVMQYLFSLSVIKPLKRCNSASINLGNILHTLNRGKLSPESFASSFNLRSGGGVFEQHCLPSALLRPAQIHSKESNNSGGKIN